MPELKEQIAEVEKQLQAERIAANQAKKPAEKVAHLRAVKKLYAKLAKLQIAAVVRAERASKVESSKLRAQRSHFMYIVMGELLRRAHGDEGIKSIITRAVAGIQKPREGEGNKVSRSASRGLVSPSAKAEGCCTEQAPGAPKR